MAQALLLRRGGAKAGLAVLAVSSAAGLPASAQDNTVAVVTALAVVLPIVYSYLLYRKQGNNKEN